MWKQNKMRQLIFILSAYVCILNPIASPHAWAKCFPVREDNAKIFRLRFLPNCTEDERTLKENDFENLLKAMAEGKEIDIDNAIIEQPLDFSTIVSRLKIIAIRDMSSDLAELFDSRLPVKRSIKLFRIIESKISITNSIIKGINLTPIMDEEPPTTFLFREGINFNHSMFRSSVIINGIVFYKGIDFSVTKFNGPVAFNDIICYGIANYVFSVFNGATGFKDNIFYGPTKFGGSTFNQETAFSSTSFIEEVSFFEPGISFFEPGTESGVGSPPKGYTTFNDEVHFDRTIFCKGADFHSTLFLGRSSFKGSVFGLQSVPSRKLLNLENIRTMAGIKEVVSLKNILKSREDNIDKEIINKIKNNLGGGNDTLLQLLQDYLNLLKEEREILHESPQKASLAEISFENSRFAHFATFEKALFLSDISFLNADFEKGWSLRKSIFLHPGILFQDPKINIKLNINQIRCNHVYGLALEQVFAPLRKYYLESDRRGKDGYSLRGEFIATHIWLEKILKESGYFEDGNEVYFQRRILERENLSGFRETWDWVLEKTCGYGVKPERVISVSGIFIICFTLSYMLPWDLLGSIEVKEKDGWFERVKIINSWSKNGFQGVLGNVARRFWHALYLSVNTFTTVGTGDIIATGFFRVLVLIEGAFGWIMLCLFTVTFVTKFLR